MARLAIINRYRPKILEITTTQLPRTDKDEVMETLTTVLVKSTQSTQNILNPLPATQVATTKYTRQRQPPARYTSRQQITKAYTHPYQPTSVSPLRYTVTKSPKVVTSHEYVASTSRPIIHASTSSPNNFDVQKVGSHISAQIYPDYVYDDVVTVVKAIPKQSKVLLYSSGVIKCFDQGNFPHPISCKKFISCAKMETGDVLGWEYTCPKGLSFDPIGGICNWETEVECGE